MPAIEVFIFLLPLMLFARTVASETLSELTVYSKPKDKGLAETQGKVGLGIGTEYIAESNFYVGIYTASVDYFEGNIENEPVVDLQIYSGMDFGICDKACNSIQVIYTDYPDASNRLASSNVEIVYRYSIEEEYEYEFGITDNKWGTNRFGFYSQIYAIYPIHEHLSIGFTLGYHGLSELPNYEAIPYWYGSSYFTYSIQKFDISVGFELIDKKARDFYGQDGDSTINLRLSYYF